MITTLRKARQIQSGLNHGELKMTGNPSFPNCHNLLLFQMLNQLFLREHGSVTYDRPTEQRVERHTDWIIG